MNEDDVIRNDDEETSEPHMDDPEEAPKKHLLEDEDVDSLDDEVESELDEEEDPFVDQEVDDR